MSKPMTLMELVENLLERADYFEKPPASIGLRCRADGFRNVAAELEAWAKSWREYEYPYRNDWDLRSHVVENVLGLPWEDK